MSHDQELHRLELAISNFLRYGVAASALLLGLGWAAQILQSGDVLANFQTYRPESLRLIMEQAIATRSYGILLSIGGLGILVLLPILRVMLTAYLFIKQRDHYLAAMA
ncbi:MAG: DUF1634 domain-containing protein, partial [Proteobacteria bacterium]